MTADRDLEVCADSAAQVFLRRIYEAGDADLTPMVYCLQNEDAVAIDRCRKCEQCLGLSIDRSSRATFLRCKFSPDGAAPPAERSPSGLRDTARPQPQRVEAGASGGSPVADIMSSPVRTVRADAPIDEIVALFMAHNISAAPVIDARGNAIGVISKTDLVRVYEGRTLGPAASASPSGPTDGDGPKHAADAMTPMVLALPAGAPIARAAALMAYEGVHHILVHDDAGRSVGIVSSLDIMGWIARRDGYVVPQGQRPQS